MGRRNNSLSDGSWLADDEGRTCTQAGWLHDYALNLWVMPLTGQAAFPTLNSDH